MLPPFVVFKPRSSCTDCTVTRTLESVSLGKHSLIEYRLTKFDQFMEQRNNDSLFKKIDEQGPLDTLQLNTIPLCEDWKAVGSPSRRGSLAMATNNSSNTNNRNSIGKSFCSNQSPAASPTPNTLSLPTLRRSSFDQSKWGSMDGFQWEGRGIFDNETRKTSLSHSTPPPSDDLVSDTYASDHQHPFSYNSSILSVPLPPGMSMEPVYRQQRSLSFSVGQDPTFFGYDNYEDVSGYGITNNNHRGSISLSYKQLLDTMEEEEQDDDDDDDDDDGDTLQGMLDQEAGATAQWRSRSQSSGAAFGTLSPAQRVMLLNQQLRRGSEGYECLDQQRKQTSRIFGDIHEPVTANLPMDTATPSQAGYRQTPMEETEHSDLLHPRLSQLHGGDFKFPDQSYNMLCQQRQSLIEPPHHYHIQQLSDQLKSTALVTSDAISRTMSDTVGHQSGTSHVGSPLQQQQFTQKQQKHQHRHNQHMDGMTALDTHHSSDNKGILLQRLPQNATVYRVEFKAGRSDYFYVVPGPMEMVARTYFPGDLVIVEGDRGKDLGKVASDVLDNVKLHSTIQEPQKLQNEERNNGASDDIRLKRLYRMAISEEIGLLLEKREDEMQALALCQQKVKLRYLPMSVVDAEYQWDRRKLTFLFVSNRRIDFRELVKELFKIYKTRIWMRAVNTSMANTTVFATPPSADTISSVV